MAVSTYGVLPGNLLSLTDQSFESGSTSWVGSVNTSAVAVSTTQAFEGTHSLNFTSAGAGLCSVVCGFINCVPGKPFVASGVVFAPAGLAIQSRFLWSVGGSTFGPSVTSTGGFIPFTVAGIAPAGATQVRLIIGVTATAASQNFYADLLYVARSESQILVDWANPAFTPTSVAGNAFSDLTPFTNIQLNSISTTHGRQDAISEAANGTLSFTVDNPLGWFTAEKTTSPWFPNVTIGARVQWNVAYIGVSGNYEGWVTRFDGAINEIDYSVDLTGQYAQATLNARDVIGILSNQPNLSCWTKERVLQDNPLYHWSLDEPSTANAALESSGNNGPSLFPMTMIPGASAGTPSGALGDTTHGVETMANSYLNNPATSPTSAPISSWHGVATAVASGTQGAGATGLVGRLPTTLKMTGTWSVECWAMIDGSQTSNWAASNTASIPIFTLTDGSHAYIGLFTNSTVSASSGMYIFTPSTTTTGVYVAGPSIVGSSFITPLGAPNHYVLTCNNGVLTVYVNGVLFGTTTVTGNTLNLGFSQVSVGMGSGDLLPNGFGGNISLFSIYNTVLSAGTALAHKNAGFVGPFGQGTGLTISQLAQYTGLPSFWTDASVSSHGLGTMDYFSIEAQPPLSTMQQVEAVEAGLLYAKADGILRFDGRDVRQGAGAPSVTLPIGSFDNNLGMKVTDQYVQTSAAIGGLTSAAVAVVNATDQARVGQYPNGSQTSPTNLPVRVYSTENPVHAQQEPYAQDIAAWNANQNSTPPLKATSLTFNIKTLTDPLSHDFYSPLAASALDVQSLIAIPAVPSFPDAQGALHFFVEGVTETFSQNAHTLGLYVSPANNGRAWIPGDATYGVVDQTAVVGISKEPATTPVGAVEYAGDPGGPWLSPTFSSTMNKVQGANGFIGASDLRGIYKQLQTMLSPPVFWGALSYTGTTQPVGASTWTTMNMFATRLDSHDGLTRTADPQGTANLVYGYRAPIAGFYAITVRGLLTYGANTDLGFYRTLIWDQVTGQKFIAGLNGRASTASFTSPSQPYNTNVVYMGVGSVVYAQAWRDFAISTFDAHLSVEFVGFGATTD